MITPGEAHKPTEEENHGRQEDREEGPRREAKPAVSKTVDLNTQATKKTPPDRHGESTVASPVKVVRDLVAAHPDWARKQVIAEGLKRGMAYYTIATQYQKAKAEQRKARK